MVKWDTKAAFGLLKLKLIIMKTAKQTYNLTTGQKIWLPLLWLYWKFSTLENKKSWHEVKKGMEKHEHVYNKPFMLHDHWWLGCEHEGCNLCEYDEERNRKTTS